MNGALIAAGLLLAVLAFALAFVPRRTAFASAAMATAAAALTMALPTVPAGFAFAACWTSLGLAALSVYWPGLARANPALCMAFSVNAGVWSGALAQTAATGLSALMIVTVVLLGIPAAWCVDRGWSIVPRVVTSWLLAVAILVGAIPLLVAHPGYVPDHRI